MIAAGVLKSENTKRGTLLKMCLQCFTLSLTGFRFNATPGGFAGAPACYRAAASFARRLGNCIYSGMPAEQDGKYFMFDNHAPAVYAPRAIISYYHAFC